MEAAQRAQDARNNGSYKHVQERKVKPQNEQALNCPRCNSTNTKFCYYNNYSLNQPRYFCKACKRYWTKGGSLRSVPVGGGSRKNKRSILSTSAMPKPIDLSQFSSQNFTTREGQDLNLGFQATREEDHHGFSRVLKLPKIENSNTNFLSASSASTTLASVLAQNLLRTGTTSDGLNSFSTTNMSNPNTMFNGARFSLQDFKPTMGFPFQGNGIKYGSFQGNQDDGERIMLSFGVLNQQHSSRESGQNMGQENSTGYWNETLGRGLSTLYN